MSTESTNVSNSPFDTEHVAPQAVERVFESEETILNEVHNQVQRILESLDEDVQSRLTTLKVTPGRTRGGGYYLFTYRTFSRTDDMAVDPIVVGLTFRPAAMLDGGGWIIIDADISGESRGDCIEALARRTVPANSEGLLRAASELAQQLCRYGRPISDALLDASRRV